MGHCKEAGRVSLNSAGFLLKAGKGDQTSLEDVGSVWGEEFDLMWGATGDQVWQESTLAGFLLKLDS